MNSTIIKYGVFLLGIYVGYAQDIYVETSLSSASIEEFKNDHFRENQRSMESC